MEYSGLSHNDSLPIPSYSKFCRKLVAGDQMACYLGQHVKKCSVKSWIKATESSPWSYAGFLKLYIKTIPRFLNLEVLRLSDTPLDLTFIMSLESLQKLTTLSISGCDFEQKAQVAPQFTKSLNLIHFEFFAPKDKLFVTLLSQFISSNSLRTLRTDYWPFLASLMRQPMDFCLQTLHIPIPVAQIDILQDFLNKTPTIQELVINRTQYARRYNQLPSLVLLESSLPQLGTIKGPTYLVTELTPGRPLTSIQIDSRIMVRDALEDATRNASRTLSALGRSTAPITLLQVPADVYLCSSFDRIFPQLDTLILEVPSYCDVAHEIDVGRFRAASGRSLTYPLFLVHREDIPQMAESSSSS